MATSILQSAARYVYLQAQRARTREEHEDFSITLKLLSLLRKGWAVPNIFNVACGFAVGLCHTRYLYKRAERAALMRREFLSITPDYDYSKETLPDRDPADGRRKFYGNKYTSRGNTQAIKEAAAKLGITRSAIYQRLRAGWTWERAISETRFRDLGAPTLTGYDAIPTGLTDEDFEATGERPGDWPNTNHRYSAPAGKRTAGFTALPVADRGGAQRKRISSPAQARIEKLRRAQHRATADREKYFGA